MESNGKNNTEGTDEHTSGENEAEQMDSIASTSSSSPKRYKFDNDSPSTSR